MQKLKLFTVAVLLVAQLGCPENTGGSDSDGPDEIETGLQWSGLVLKSLIEDGRPLIDAYANVEIDGRSYSFALERTDTDPSEFPVLSGGGCSVLGTLDDGFIVLADFDMATTPLDLGDEFSLWTPGGFAPIGDGTALGAASVQWGLFDASEGTARMPSEWAPTPSDNSGIECWTESAIGSPPISTCRIYWAGLASENFYSGPPEDQKKQASIDIECVFLAPEQLTSQCGGVTCNDDNPCTSDICNPDDGECVFLPKDYLLAEAFDQLEDPGWLELWALSQRRCETEAGGVGLCTEGVCEPSACGDSCDFEFQYDSETDSCGGETCNTASEPPSCELEVWPTCSG